MKQSSIVTPSSQVDSTLPIFIVENYERFVEFMKTAAESEERLGFGQDLLQHLLEYQRFDTYKNEIVEYNYLSNPYTDFDESLFGEQQAISTGANVAILGQETASVSDTIFILAESEDRIMKLNDSYGFPDKNGVIMIDDEIILYREKRGDYLFDLKRGAAGTYILPTFTYAGEYAKTEPARHLAGAKVYNLSVLFMVAMLGNIHRSFTPGIDSTRVAEEINRSSLLANIKDFFRSKGSKLGVKSLFKILFAENDVEVEYPGDRMITPSKSTWNESDLCRVVPVPEIFCVPTEINETPAKLIDVEVKLKSYLDEKVYARFICDYVSSYPYEDTVQYEFYVQKDTTKGNIVANPNTLLTRDLNKFGTIDDRLDVFTVTVESTLGFPEKGVIFIDNEAILYTERTFNQFLNCTRGYIGVVNPHKKGAKVYGPYYLEGRYIEDGIEKVSRSFPLGLVEDVDIVDPGVLHTIEDEVYVNGPGRIDPREPIMESFIENIDDELADQVRSAGEIGFIGNYTAGVSGIYFDQRHVFAASSNLPYYPIGNFGSTIEYGKNVRGFNRIHVIPRREEIQPNTMFSHKGTNRIGSFVDGVSAYSCVSPEKYVSGKIAKITVVVEGHGYVNPTLVIGASESPADIVVENGKIISVTETEPENWVDNPYPRISSGEGAKIELSFDQFGRVTQAFVVDKGKFYKDTPYISVVDATNRGKGALLSCTTNDDHGIETVTIVYPGIDYNPLTTEAEVIPIGAECVINAVVQHYEYDRVYEINNTANMDFDSGNGFIFEDTTRARTSFGYLGDPEWLRTELNDTGSYHSPLLGWAYDGNPIYGPYGYKNRTDDSDGIQQYFSGYVLRKDRTEAPAGGGEDIGTAPPTPAEFEMGTFVQDYEYDKYKAMLRKYLLNSEDPHRLVAEPIDKWLSLKDQTLEEDQILNEYNGMYCNTPEFPKELYPGGVFCYFLTVDIDGSMQFPYIMGPTFHNRPISQNILLNTTEQLEPIGVSYDGGGLVFDPDTWYDDTRLEFDFKLVERFRNVYLRENRDQVDLRIGEISKGGIYECLVERADPPTAEVGDLVLFNNAGTKGTGAQAKVSFVQGSEVDFAYGRDLRTCTVSHTQRVNLKWGPHEDVDNYLFILDQLIVTSSGAEGHVINFDYDAQFVDIKIRTPNLILEGDIFYDVKGRQVNVGYLNTGAIPTVFVNNDGNLTLDADYNPDTGLYSPLNDENAQYYMTHLTTEDGLTIVDEDNTNIFNVAQPLRIDRPNRSTRLYAAHCEPIDDNQIGDLWWSHKNGRLYVWYEDENTSQWVCTQPLGMIPLNGASDFGIGTTAETNQFFNHYSTENTITISRKAPSMRKDGSRNLYGDLWWSSHTGILYIWNDGLCGSCGPLKVDDIQTAGEWVCTDPNAKVPTIGASDKNQFYRTTRQLRTFPINSTVSMYPPKDADEGTLWWCPRTAKMYVSYDEQWVITNPVAMVSSKYSFDDIVEGGGGASGGGPLVPLPDTDIEEGISEIWFRDLTYFVPKDEIRFNVGAPGTGDTEDAILDAILRLGPPDKGRVIRGEEPIPIPDGTRTVDLTRSLYIINTKTPHGLRAGDYIKIENSLYDEVNDVHQIVDAGVVDPAKGRARVKDGKVISVQLSYPGRYYSKNFYVYFYGGGGTGALGFAEVDPLSEGGGINTITILDGGVNYTTSPDILFGTELTNTAMILYMSETYGRDPYITYSTPKRGIQGKPAYFLVTSPGKGYEELPICEGLVKKYSDRAVTKITMNGGKITDVDVISGGRRYYSPMAIFRDLTNFGSGAIAYVDVKNGVVQGIEMLNEGEGYVEPVVYLVETSGKYFCTTYDIGKIKSFRILNPGRDISPDPSLKPELQITTRVILTDVKGAFLPLQQVYQGTETNKQVIGIVDNYNVDDQLRVISTEDATEAVTTTSDDIDYDDSGILVNESFMNDRERQILTLVRVEGNLKHGEMIYSPTGEGMVVLEGQADCRVVIDGDSSPEGDFIDDTSKVSEAWPVIQDSYYYQWFSYVVRSSLQQVEYKNFVYDIIHPAGFIMFSDVTVNDSISSTVNVSEVSLVGFETPVPIDPEFPPVPAPPVEDLEVTVNIFPRQDVFVGDTIRAVAVTNGGVQPLTTTYQWQQDLGAITSWTNFPGATEATFTIPSSRNGWAFRCVVETTDGDGTTVRVVSLQTSPAQTRP